MKNKRKIFYFLKTKEEYDYMLQNNLIPKRGIVLIESTQEIYRNKVPYSGYSPLKENFDLIKDNCKEYTDSKYNDVLNSIKLLKSSINSNTNNNTDINKVKTKLSNLENKLSDLEFLVPLISSEFAKVATSGKYDDLINKPNIPIVPKNVSEFVNDIGYLTKSNVNNASDCTWTATAKAKTWSRLFKLAVPEQGSSYIVTLSCKRIDMMAIFLVNTKYNTGGHVIRLVCSSNNPSMVGYENELACRVVSNTEGDSYFEIQDNILTPIGYNMTQWFCNVLELGEGELTPYHEFTNGNIVEEGYIISNAVVADQSSNSSAIDNIYIAGDQFFARRQDGSTITIGNAAVLPDWNQTNETAIDYIKNKPNNLVQDTSYVHTDNNFTSILKNKLDNIAAGALVNVQPDWNQTNTSADNYIKNKPTIPSLPNLARVATTGSYNDLSNKPTIPTVPTKVSAFTNDAGYLTEHLDVSTNYYFKQLVNRVSALETAVAELKSFFCKLTLTNGTVVNVEGEGTLTAAMVTTPYGATVASAEVGTLCTGIGGGAFAFCTHLTSAKLSSSVTSIGAKAFEGCSSLTHIEFFLTGITSIGNNAFSGCTQLTAADLPNSVTSVGTGAFSNCTSLTRCVLGFGVSEIKDSTFQGCSSLSNITIPNNITKIGEEVFSGCTGLKNITIPNSVTSIGDFAFEDCTGLTGVTLSTALTTIAGSTFSGCTKLNNVTIPANVTSIGASAFSDCSSLTSITIPDSVTSIGSNAFKGCSGLTSIILPENVTSIGSNAFANCSTLVSVTCHPLSVPTLGTSAFASNASGRKIYVHLSSLNAYKTATNWSSYASDIQSIEEGGYLCRITLNNGDTITLEDSGELRGAALNNYTKTDIISAEIGLLCTSIGSYVFKGASNMTSVTISDNVTSIGEQAFYGCESLTSVIIPNSVISLGSSAFDNCSNLVSATIGNGVTSIGNSSFNNCTSLVYTNIPNSVVSIGSSAFSGCTSLTSIVIPNSVTSIGVSAFKNTGWYNNQADGILYLNNWLIGYKGAAPTGELHIVEGTKGIGEHAFNHCSNLTLVTIPNSMIYIGKNAFNSCSGITSITIPDSVISIDDNTFYACTNLISVYIPLSVTSIGSGAFAGSGLVSVTIPDSVTTIGQNAFSCGSLSNVIVLATTPPELKSSSVFSGNAEGRKIYVQAESVNAYKTAAVWNSYAHVIYPIA